MGTGRPKKGHCRARADSSSEDEAMPPVFPVGAEVEARIDDLGFAGSFYEAIVIARLPTGDGYEVLYDTLEGDEGEPVLERAPAANVRPRPPPPSPAASEEETRSFAVREMVEAFYNGGWWAGVVLSAPPPDRRLLRVYKVAFPTTWEEIEFEEAALRPHQVFQAGRWVPAAEALKEGSPPGNTIKEVGKIRGISEETKEPRDGSHDVDLPSETTPASGILPETSAVCPVNLTQRDDNQDSVEICGSYEWGWYNGYVTIESSLLPTLRCGANGFVALVNGESVMHDRPSESENLPFVKTSRVWPLIEAMEVFQQTPQRPHFHHLRQYAPEQREEVALGLMFCFKDLAESIVKLNVEDDRAIFQQKIEGLSLLQGDGFDVRDLRSRLEALLHMKNQDAVSMIEEKISHIEITADNFATKMSC